MNDKGKLTLHDPKSWHEVDPLVIRAMELTGATYEELNAGVSLCVDVWDANCPTVFLISWNIPWSKYIYELTGFALARYFWTQPYSDSPFMEAVSTELTHRRTALELEGTALELEQTTCELETRKENDKKGGAASGFEPEIKTWVFDLYDGWKKRNPKKAISAFYSFMKGEFKKSDRNETSKSTPPALSTIRGWIRNRADTSDCSPS